MDDAPREAAAARPAGLSSYTCRACGAAQALAPGAEALTCGHCGATTPIAPVARAIVEHDFETARTRVRRGPAAGLTVGAREVQCRTCGARSVTARHADRCPFCDAALVVELPPSADTILPDAVVPFAVAQADADAIFQAWLRARWFAPGDLKRRAERGGLDGIYVPYWLYDADSTTRYTGARGEHYWVEEAYTDRDRQRRTRQVRRTRWHATSGTVRLRFDDVAVCASSGMPRNRMAQLEPWKLDGLRPFDNAYLAGFVAERYSVDLEDGWTRAQGVMEGRIATAVRRDIGGDEQRVHNLDVRHRAVTFKHVLLPVWVSSFRYRGQVYRVVVNAQTREVAGDRPWSVWKIALTVLAIAALIVGVVLLVHRRPAPAPPAPPAPIKPGPGLTAPLPAPAP
ncbi:MAG: hypothetical protein IPL61_07195 [Myxococcales bacterium]|nr:hypothetical protein [Myxococcales bacterium]